MTQAKQKVDQLKERAGLQVHYENPESHILRLQLPLCNIMLLRSEIEVFGLIHLHEATSFMLQESCHQVFTRCFVHMCLSRNVDFDLKFFARFQVMLSLVQREKYYANLFLYLSVYAQPVSILIRESQKQNNNKQNKTKTASSH